MIRQTWAIFFDAYRELNAKRLFWLVLILSGLIVAAFAMLGINERGLTFLHLELGWGLSTAVMPREVFYKSFLFTEFGIKLWLGWVATILALISTASIFPDFIASGAIEMSLSKPIGRLRLFLTKYVAGLLFVTLQMSVFTAACFLVIGVRGGAWEPGLFLAVPLVVLFFSYLFAVCVLFGVLTRSTIASLLLTLLVWAAVFFLHLGEQGVLYGKLYNEQRAETLRSDIAAREAELAAAADAESGGIRGAMTKAFSVPMREQALARRREQLEDARWWEGTLQRVHTGLFATKTALPKVSETKELIERTLISQADLRGLMPRDDGATPLAITDTAGDVPVDESRLQSSLLEAKRSRSAWWILGTSLIFEVAVVGLAAWVFCRRDF